MLKFYCKTAQSKLCSIVFWQHKLVIVCICTSLYLAGSSSYIYAKAVLAQYLIKDAWSQSLHSNQTIPPWPWADTYPVAKLNILDRNYYVLAGITGRTLAFGPGHMSSTPLPGQTGNAVIAGHRDTHFSVLDLVGVGEIIEIETKAGINRYKVNQTNIVHEQDMSVTQSSNEALLTLVTCYPFDAIKPNPEWRYVIQAYLLDNTEI